MHFFIIVDLQSVSLTARDNGIQTINSAKSLIEVTDSLEETLFSHSFPIFSSRSTRHDSTRERRIRRFVWQRIKLLYKNVKGFASANRFRGLRGSKEQDVGSTRTMEPENSKCDWEPHCF